MRKHRLEQGLPRNRASVRRRYTQLLPGPLRSCSGGTAARRSSSMTPGATGSAPTGRPAHFPGHPQPRERLCHDSKQDGITESHEDRFQQVTSLKPSSYDAPATWFPLKTPVSRLVAVPVWSATSQCDGGPPALLGAPARSPCCVSRTRPGYTAPESSVTVPEHSIQRGDAVLPMSCVCSGWGLSL